jgi:Flp pilus assembly protein TadG
MVRRRRIQDENGQTMVEFALVLPLLCVVLFGIVQFGILYNNYVTLTDATRAGARKAAVSRMTANPESVTRASVRASASGLTLTDADIDVTVAGGVWEHGTDVTVAARHAYKIDLLGLVVAAGDLESTTTERVE